MRILIFGDSIAQGYYDLDRGGWANLLFIQNMRRKARRTDYSVEMFNMSVSGDTVRRVTGRLKNEVNARKWEDEPIALVFSVGINDAMIQDDQPVVSLEQFRADVEELYATAHPLTQHIVFVGLTTVNEAESDPWVFNSGTSTLRWQNERIEQFDEVLRNFASENETHFIDVFEPFKAAQARGRILHEDGIHPNAAGHQLIFEQVRPIVDELCN